MTNHLRTVTQRQLNVNCRVLFRLMSDGGREVLEMRKGIKPRETMSWAFAGNGLKHKSFEWQAVRLALEL